ncbi:hypothetical protein SAMN05216554_3256 [Herbiconiux ginsengi]|uniref:N-acetyltransferase domain-containing protein n=1 Tax=Herbiconiux ginsengi TaxID=381665 RepID=A0A1H3S229_9MICO|nr:hypothetical protein SAMN05216554_3256 [Herbiconiux ginsengi]
MVKADSSARSELEARGWVVIARSWGAGLTVDDASHPRLSALRDGVEPLVTVRELEPADVDAVLALDRETLDDYPGDVATAHEALTEARATPTPDHRGWGAFAHDAHLVAMTFVDIGREVVETDFTVVRRGWRGQGLGSAVKSASVLALSEQGHVRFRTGGSMDNPASIAANRAVGYERDEEWLTFVADGEGLRGRPVRADGAGRSNGDDDTDSRDPTRILRRAGRTAQLGRSVGMIVPW